MLKANTQILAEKRILKGWGKSDLAKAAGLSHSVVVRAEQGMSTSPKTAKAIADALQAPLTELFIIRPTGRG